MGKERNQATGTVSCIFICLVAVFLLFGSLAFRMLYRGSLFLGPLTSQLDPATSVRFSYDMISLEDTVTLCKTTDKGSECFSYLDFPLETGIKVNDDPECYTYCWQMDAYLTISYKRSDFRQSHLIKHLEDHLLYLNTETGRAELVYRSDPHTRILYGNSQLVIVYDADDNVYMYIDCTTGNVLAEIKANIQTRNKQYTFSIDEQERYLFVYENNAPQTYLDRLPLSV